MAKSLISPTPPPGLTYQRDFLSEPEEQAVLAALQGVEFKPVIMRGVEAKRRVNHFGWDYQYDAWKIFPTDPFPDFIAALRDRAAAFAGVAASVLEQVLIADYPAGSGIGWHRDAPMFGSPVVGISLLSDCRMQFRKKTDDGFVRFNQWLERRSIYSIGGEARTDWQHGITAMPSRRFSITFRVVKEGFKKARAG